MCHTALFLIPPKVGPPHTFQECASEIYYFMPYPNCGEGAYVRYIAPHRFMGSMQPACDTLVLLGCHKLTCCSRVYAGARSCERGRGRFPKGRVPQGRHSHAMDRDGLYTVP
jgi:hypothetical protein